jgi:hypothetical protein
MGTPRRGQNIKREEKKKTKEGTGTKKKKGKKQSKKRRRIRRAREGMPGRQGGVLLSLVSRRRDG